MIKKILAFLLILIFMGIICFDVLKVNDNDIFNTKVYSSDDINGVSTDDEMTESISKKIIRFHVIANSDSEEDQELKIKVRDEILSYIEPKLKNSSSIEESRKILKSNDKKIKEIALKCVKDNGYKYSITSTLDKENFPSKTYGNITLPQGTYEAYRIIIGSGRGKNWWCVMFPPLCFIDITKGQISYKKSESEMKRVLNDKEFKSIDNQDKFQYNDKKIVYTFKIKEIIDSIFK